MITDAQIVALYFDGFTEDDLPFMKALFAETPLYLHPSQAKHAAMKGFEEGVHFHIIRPTPTAGRNIYMRP